MLQLLTGRTRGKFLPQAEEGKRILFYMPREGTRIPKLPENIAGATTETDGDITDRHTADRRKTTNTYTAAKSIPRLLRFLNGTERKGPLH